MKAILYLFLAVFFSCDAPQEKKVLRIAAASNAQHALIDIADAYKQKHEIDIEIISASSGKLTAQISQGAPYDIFVSADMKFPMRLYENALCKQTPRVYGYGRLVLWSMTDSLLVDENNLCKQDNKKFVVANPVSSPYGQASMEVLQYYHCNLDAQEMLIGENINKASQLIRESVVSFGFSAAAIVHNKANKAVGYWKLIPESAHQPIAQSAVIIASSEHPNSTDFFNYLFSPEAQKILRNYAYRIPK